MLNKEEEATLEQYVANMKTLPKGVVSEYITLPIVDVLWLIEKLKETNDICRKYHLYKRPPMGIIK